MTDEEKATYKTEMGSLGVKPVEEPVAVVKPERKPRIRPEKSADIITYKSDVPPLIQKAEVPALEFYEEPGYLRIVDYPNGVRRVRFLPKYEAEFVLRFIGAKSTQHRGKILI